MSVIKIPNCSYSILELNGESECVFRMLGKMGAWRTKDKRFFVLPKELADDVEKIVVKLTELGIA